MPKLTSAVLSIIALGSILGASSVLAAPRASATYRGSGLDVFNNGPRWRAAPGAAQKISFRISQNRSRVLDFRGRYLYYCGAGSSTITAASLKIRHGRFGGTGKRVNSAGTNYFALSGQFSADGLHAKVTYLDDFVSKGKSVKSPYSFAYHSPAQACESRVTGTATAG
ncbi:MAG: hypothetical protein WCB67_12845 [Solirubrobacteraceae bacterium]